jgi:choline-glycine betaine transporter
MLSTTTQPHNSSVLARTAFWLFVLVLYILIFLFDLIKRVEHGVKRASMSKEHPELTNTAWTYM